MSCVHCKRPVKYFPQSLKFIFLIPVFPMGQCWAESSRIFILNSSGREAREPREKPSLSTTGWSPQPTVSHTAVECLNH